LTFILIALELDSKDWLTMYYYGEMKNILGYKDEARKTFQEAALLEMP